MNIQYKNDHEPIYEKIAEAIKKAANVNGMKKVN